MGFFNNLSKLFKSDEPEVVVEAKTLKNLKTGNVIKFDITDQPEISGKSLVVQETKEVKLQSGKTLTYHQLDNGFFIRPFGNDKFEIVKEINKQELIDLVDDEFHNIMNIEGDEIVHNEATGKHELASKESKFSTVAEINGWTPVSDFYTIHHEIECSSNLTEQINDCCFYRGETLDNKHALMFTATKDIVPYVSVVLPDYNVESII